MLGGAISWISSGGGDWGTASSWSSGAVPNSSTDVADALAGVVTISSPETAQSLTINNASGTVEVLFSALTLSGLLNLQAGAFVLDGTLTGGTIAATGGSFQLGGFSSVVTGITYEGALTLGAFQYLTINGITLLGPGGTGAGTLAVTAGQVIFGTTQTITAGTISLGNGGLTPSFEPVLSVSQGATLSLGSQALLQVAGKAEVVSGAIVNAGTIAALVNGDTLSISGSLLNQGMIAIGQNDDVVFGPGGTLTNTGTIIVAGGGTLDLWGSLVNSGSVNAAGGTIMADSAVTVAELLALKADGGALVLAGTLDNSGAVIQVGSSAALGTLAVTGTIRNGTIRDQGGGLVLNGGTLDGVTYQGTLAVATNPYPANTIVDGLTLGNGSALVINTGLLFGNTETIAGGLIDLGGVAPAAFGASAGATVTFAAGVDIELTGATVGIGGSYSSGIFSSLQTGQVFNSLGTLDAGYAGGVMTLGYAAELVNAGLMGVRNGTTFLAQGTLANTGTLVLGSGGTLAIAGSPLWSNTGTIIGAGGTVLLTGPVTNAELVSFAGSGARLLLEGILDNSAGSLAIGGGSALGAVTLGTGGTIRGGTISDGGGGLIGAAGTLDGVTYQGTLGLTHPNDLLTITDGITMTGTSGPGGTIAVTGDGAALTFANGQTLSAAVAIGAAAAEADVATGGPGATLTLAPGTSVTQTGRLAGLIASAGTIANQGTIVAALPGGHFNLLVTSGTLLNSGTIDVANMDVATIGSLTNAGQVTVKAGALLTIGGYSATPGARLIESAATLRLNGTFGLATLKTLTRSGGIVTVGGTLDLGGGTLAVGGATAMGQIRDSGVVIDGTIADSGGGMVYYGGVGELANVTYQGPVNMVPALSNLIVQNISVLPLAGSGPGSINMVGAGSTLAFLGSQTLNNATVNFGSNILADTIHIEDPTGTGATLTIGTTGSFQQRGGMAEILIDRGLGDALINTGVIGANYPNGNMILLGGTFTNAGQVVVSNGDTLTLQADQMTNLVGSTLSGGYWQADSNSVLNLGMDNPITTLSTSLVLNGPGSQVQSYSTAQYQSLTLDQTLGSITSAGALGIAAGRVFNDPGTLTVSGNVLLSAGTLSAQAINDAGLIIGTGFVGGGKVSDAGHVYANGGQLVVSVPILAGGPGGNVIIGAGSTLLASQAVAVPIIFLASTGTLALGQPNNVTGTVVNFTGSDAIDLVNVGSAGLSLSYTPGAGSGVLTVKSGASTVASLRFNGSYVLGNFRVASDGQGGTLILDPPVPAASPDWQVTLADFGPPPAAAAQGGAGAGGTIAGTGAIVMPPEPTQAPMPVHQ